MLLFRVVNYTCHHFYLRRQTLNCVYSDLGMWQGFLENEQSKPVISNKTSESICADEKI